MYLESEIRKHVGNGKSYYITSSILQNNDFSVDFIVRDNYYKDRSISFNVTECKHIAWNVKHFYDIKMKKVWPSEKQNMKDKRLDENEVKKFLSGKLCWKLNGYEFDEGKFYQYDPNF